MTFYRDPDVLYRQPGQPYRGEPAQIPGFDMDRLDNTQVLVVDKFGQPYGELPAAQLSTVRWKLIGENDTDAGSTAIGMSAYDPNTAQVRSGEREIQIIFWDAIRADTGEPLIWWGRAQDDHRVPGWVEFEITDVSSWLQERLVSVNKDYGPTATNPSAPLIEQLDIAWDLITFAQTGPNMDLNFNSTYTPSGRQRERHYTGDQKSFVWDLLCNFIGLIDGFDWWFDYDLSGNRLWVPEYPFRGVVTDFVFEWGHNIAGYDLKSTDKQVITRYWAQGGDDGDGHKMEVSYEDVDASFKFGVRERAGGEGSQESTEAGLLEAAQSKVGANKGLARTFSLAVWEGTADSSTPPTSILGNLWPGDFAQIIIQDGDTDLKQITGTDLFRLKSMDWLPGGGIDLEFFL